jgi:AbrB family looped-hinge helix DNA binding protein
MKTTIDGAGRVVVPKALRDEVGLTGGQTVEIEARDGHLVIEPAATPMRLERLGKHVAAVPRQPLPPLTADLVRETLERVRR